MPISSEFFRLASGGRLARCRSHLPGVFAAISVLFAAQGQLSAFADEGPAVWYDTVTGYAIGGYDPVGYFTHNSALKGLYGIEYSWRGSVWKFQNEGNRAAFERDPTVYAPRFAGYDPYGLAEGRVVEGLPTLWQIHQDKLYFFQNVINKRVWAEDPEGVLQKAERHWPEISRSLPWK